MVGLIRRSQGAVAAAGLIALPLSVTSFGLVTLPLLLPAVLFLVGAGRLPPSRWIWLETPLLFAASLAAWFLLIIPREMIEYTFPGGSGSSQESTLAGALAALALIAAAVVVAWLWPRSFRSPESELARVPWP